MATLFRPFIDLWQRLTLGQRAGLVLATGLALALAAGAVSYSTRPVYTTLYTGLSGKDASQIVDKLRERKIPFEVGADGTIVKVPQNLASELRLDFAGQGLPRSGEIGYELFDKPMLGMTDFVQKMNYHRALEGELGRTISELDAVESARVHLVVPSPRLFREDQKSATASIAIQLRPGASLTPQQVQAIAYMTAYSVEGLDADHITIVDMRGNLLSGATTRDSMVGLSATQLEVQRSVESQLERKALALLENTLGPNRAQVQVTAKLNWDRVERTIENYDAENAATLSEERQESVGDVDEEGAGGATSERTVTNYQVPRTVEKFVPEVGNIERLSASVLVDGVYEEVPGEDGTTTRTYRERTPQELDKFRTLVAAAIGFDRTRQDELTVISFPFAQEEQPTPTTNALPWMKIIEKALLGLALVGLFLLARTLILRLMKGVPALPAGAAMGALGEGETHYALTGGAMPRTPAELAARAEGAAAALQEGPHITREGSGPHVIFKQNPQTIVVEEEAPSIEVLKHQELLKRTTDYIVQKPDQATQILRGWILDESSEKLGR